MIARNHAPLATAPAALSTGPHNPTADVLSARSLAWSTALTMAALLSASAAVSVLARAPLVRAGKHFVHALGGLGVAIGYLVPDALNLPVPNDLVSLLGRAGGMSFGQVVVWGSAGSLLGGSAGWAIGR